MSADWKILSRCESPRRNIYLFFNSRYRLLLTNKLNTFEPVRESHLFKRFVDLWRSPGSSSYWSCYKVKETSVKCALRILRLALRKQWGESQEVVWKGGVYLCSASLTQQLNFNGLWRPQISVICVAVIMNMKSVTKFAMRFALMTKMMSDKFAGNL